MDRVFVVCLLVLGMVFAGSNAMADWRTDYIDALDQGQKDLAQEDTEGGLGYHPTEEGILGEAIPRALEEAKGAGCDIMKLAVERNYTPIEVIKTIFVSGGELDMNEMCTCATESGVIKTAFQKAAMESFNEESGRSAMMDEVSQTQCFGGLAYTPEATPFETIARPDKNPVDTSPSTL